MLTRRTQEERREATSDALLAAGRKLFGARGYAGVSSATLAAAAGLTTGAVYHHFEDKAALFRAVFESVEAELAVAVLRAAAGPGDPLSRLEKCGCAMRVEWSGACMGVVETHSLWTLASVWLLYGFVYTCTCAAVLLI